MNARPEPSDLEKTIERIYDSAEELKKKLDLIKETPGNGNSNNSNLIKNYSRLRELEKENKSIKQALEEHQYGIEFIMTRYRAQIDELIKLQKIEKSTLNSENYSKR